MHYPSYSELFGVKVVLLMLCILCFYFVANSLLRLAVDGKIVMCVYPPGFIAKRGQLILYFQAIVIITELIDIRFFSY